MINCIKLYIIYTIYWCANWCCIQKMWLGGGGGQTECFQNVGGDKGVYNVLTFQKSRGEILLNETLQMNTVYNII